MKHLNIPYFDLIDGVEDILDQIPSDQEVLVVCAKEGSSVMVAEMLAEHGRIVAYLKSGMKAWSEYLVPLKVGNLADGGELYQFVRIGKGCLSYMAVSSCVNPDDGHQNWAGHFMIGRPWSLWRSMIVSDVP